MTKATVARVSVILFCTALLLTGLEGLAALTRDLRLLKVALLLMAAFAVVGGAFAFLAGLTSASRDSAPPDLRQFKKKGPPRRAAQIGHDGH